MPPLITADEEALQAGADRGPRRDRSADRPRVEGPPGALWRLHGHVLARQRQVRRVCRGLRLLRAVAVRRGGHADARDDDPRADPRARAGGRGRRRPPVLHGHPGAGAVKAGLLQRARRRQAGGRAHQPQALRVDRAHVGQAGQAAREAGIQRVHHNVETAESYYDEVSTTVRYEGRLRTIQAVEEAGLETCVGGILNLGESREQRVEMAFELAKIDPTSVPINMLNPRPGTKFGDRDYMDPWEAVKWIAIFRLILPAALFRLCGGRVENLGELQPLAVKAGINGVMMGNFLTTLGNEPEHDRAMFEELGLNVARQPDNGANPRPDNRSGWLDGESPRTPVDELIDHQAEANFWNPEVQLTEGQEEVRAAASGWCPQPRARARRGGGTTPVTDIEEALDQIRAAGLMRRLRMISGPQGPRVLLDGKPVLLLCSNNYLGLADHPRVREAAAEAAMRYGAGAGASRLISGTMRIHRRLEERLADVRAHRDSASLRVGLPRQHRRDPNACPQGRSRLLRRSQPRQHGRRLPPRRGGDVRLRAWRRGPSGVGPGAGGGTWEPDRDRRRVLDGRRRRAPAGDRGARARARRARDGRRGAWHRRSRTRAAGAQPQPRA